VDYTHIGDRGIDSTHDYGGEPEVSQWLQESLDNFVRQGIIDQESDRSEPEVSSRLQGREERTEVARDDYDHRRPHGRSRLVRGLWSGGAN
jgi:hypothetical protein